MHRKIAICLIALLSLSVLMPSVGPAKAETDPFGITQLYQTVSNGRTWNSSDWNNNIARTLPSGSRDPYDPTGDFIARGDGSITIDGKGTAIVVGSAPRLYLYDAAKKKTWNNVEVTFYAQRINESQTLSYQGFEAVAKTDHTDDADLCGTRGYGGRMLYDGRIDFEKEIDHHASDGYVQFGTVNPWSSLPKNQWIGYKLVAYDIDSNSVKLELYRDLTGGLNGGTWQLMTSAVDSGQYGSGHTACTSGVNPAQVLTGPNVAIYIRNDGLGQAQYKWFSVREIAAGTTLNNPSVQPAQTPAPQNPETIITPVSTAATTSQTTSQVSTSSSQTPAENQKTPAARKKIEPKHQFRSFFKATVNTVTESLSETYSSIKHWFRWKR